MGLTVFDGYIYLSFVMVSYRFDIRDRLALFGLSTWMMTLMAFWNLE